MVVIIRYVKIRRSRPDIAPQALSLEIDLASGLKGDKIHVAPAITKERKTEKKKNENKRK